jgi:hypothetical protein
MSRNMIINLLLLSVIACPNSKSETFRNSESNTTEELNFLATFPFITLKKQPGAQPIYLQKMVQLKLQRQLTRMLKILYYINVIVHYVSYAVNSTLGNISEPFLKHKTTGEVLQLVGTNPGYDLSKAEVRKWWVDNCVFISNHQEIDGIYVDGSLKVLSPTYFLSQL